MRGVTAGSRSLLSALALTLLIGGCGPARSQELTVEIVRELPHDERAFTQGLLLQGGILYESTGLVGRSSLRAVDPTSGEVIRQRDIPAPYFAEGLALVGNELLQLTYRAGKLFRWDLETFEPTGEQDYAGEGWGLCFDGDAVWMSNGSAVLARRDPATFEVLSEITVSRNGERVPRLNELECVGDAIYANVWLTDEIVIVDPDSGNVTATIDASMLRDSLPAGLVRDAVLNGIAYDPERELFLVTGKLWPSLFEVRFAPAED